ncbi:hypothetical protein GCM10025871_09360 [Deinococcus metallilatus]|nr:hypothetical protein GCM10025871_09360 [Deinococcus metallilatus]
MRPESASTPSGSAPTNSSTPPPKGRQASIPSATGCPCASARAATVPSLSPSPRPSSPTATSDPPTTAHTCTPCARTVLQANSASARPNARTVSAALSSEGKGGRVIAKDGTGQRA